MVFSLFSLHLALISPRLADQRKKIENLPEFQ
jgi:hypothetical protein